MAIDPRTRELIGIAASIAAKCGPCFNYHYEEAIRLRVSESDILEAIDLAKEIRAASGRHMDESAEKKMRRRAKNSRS